MFVWSLQPGDSFVSKKSARRRNLNRYMATSTDSNNPGSARMFLTAYDAGHIFEKEISDIAEINHVRGEYPTLWLHVIGLTDVALTNKIGQLFGLHELALEDVGNVQHRAKVEQYGEQYFVVSHLIKMNQALETSQVSMFIAKDFVVSWQEGQEDELKGVRERLRRANSRARQAGPDYLSYMILDTVIDTYFPALEIYGERLEKLEDDILENSSRKHVGEIHQVKRELLAMRRAIWPLREAINELIRDGSSLFSEESRVHMRDCYDHTVQAIDFLETYRELGSDLMDVYLSTVSNKMNEVMKVLTIITTIFVPAGLIASVYGMNFHTETSPYNMPELTWYYGYPFALGLMLFTATTTVLLLRWRGFLGASNT
jgi:magnesium transporter